MDSTTTVAQLRAKVLQFARERDWEQFHSPKNLSMALAVEASELMEHFMWDTPDQSVSRVSDPEVAEELADIVVYALEFANIAGIDLSTAIEQKMLKNAAKYPVEKAKGNALKYDKLD